MASDRAAAVTAVLGPTNTGKTHLAIERMCAHSSGMIGFPLRLLAREVYDRLVAIKGPASVGLLTGEEKILPVGARWIACTTESMPVDRDVAFAALDEAQLGADAERGHVFTDRMLRVRGREETMILGSATMRPVVRALVPEAEVIDRPRFSTLSYAGAKKLSRLPKRSAIVAFSAEEVYAVAEMLRRTRGGAAVVMGALSPRTRNAQVAMFQAGEVDYLVATDAIGMGLNMDVSHVAFAALDKFDGVRQRRLTVSEMAQIAGRAGRHQRDGTFGSMGAEDAPNAFRPEEIEAIEEHRFPRLDWVYWREGVPDLSSLDALIASLEAPPAHERLRPAPRSVDLSVLKRLAAEEDVRDRIRSPFAVKRLWAACGLPDFRKLGSDHHVRLVARVFKHLSEGDGRLPVGWFADEIARLDRVDGDVDTIGARLAGVRTWAYIAHRADWMADPAHWARRTEAVEERLSDALHARLTERFVDRRTSILMKQLGNDPDLLDVEIGEDGAVEVEGVSIGRLDGFRFHVDPSARGGERKRLLAAAERHLVRERARRAAALVATDDDAFAVSGMPVTLTWRGQPVAELRPGRALTEPVLRPDAALGALDPDARDAVLARVAKWLGGKTARHLSALREIESASRSPATEPAVRAILAGVASNGGTVPRTQVDGAIDALDRDGRRLLTRGGLTVGSLDVFDARLLKPGALEWVALLHAVRDGTPQPPAAPRGATVFHAGSDAPGFRRFGELLVRVDIVERIAKSVHDGRIPGAAFAIDPALGTPFGVDPVAFALLVRALGFRAESDGLWRWGSRPRARTVPARSATGTMAGAFATLGSLGTG